MLEKYNNLNTANSLSANPVQRDWMERFLNIAAEADDIADFANFLASIEKVKQHLTKDWEEWAKKNNLVLSDWVADAMNDWNDSSLIDMPQ